MQYGGKLSPDSPRRGLKFHFGKKRISFWKKCEVFLDARKIKKAPFKRERE